MEKYRRTRFYLVVVILFAIASFAGCNETPATNVPPPGPPLVPVALPVLEAILAYFVSHKSLSLNGERFANRVSRHKGFFVWRRARYLGERNAPWWLKPTNRR